MSSQATMSAERLLSTIGLLFACISLAKIYLHDFVVVQELASLFQHRSFKITEKTQHARGLTILYPLRPGTLHGNSNNNSNSSSNSGGGKTSSCSNNVNNSNR